MELDVPKTKDDFLIYNVAERRWEDSVAILVDRKCNIEWRDAVVGNLLAYLGFSGKAKRVLIEHIVSERVDGNILVGSYRDIVKLTGVSLSTVAYVLGRMESLGLLTTIKPKIRVIDSNIVKFCSSAIVHANIVVWDGTAI